MESIKYVVQFADSTTEEGTWPAYLYFEFFIYASLDIDRTSTKKEIKHIDITVDGKTHRILPYTTLLEK